PEREEKEEELAFDDVKFLGEEEMKLADIEDQSSDFRGEVEVGEDVLTSPLFTTPFLPVPHYRDEDDEELEVAALRSYAKSLPIRVESEMPIVGSSDSSSDEEVVRRVGGVNMREEEEGNYKFKYDVYYDAYADDSDSDS
ncbi:hypothetical protein BTE48_17110, partial [Oceanospirillum multiglobuliferum]